MAVGDAGVGAGRKRETLRRALVRETQQAAKAEEIRNLYPVIWFGGGVQKSHLIKSHSLPVCYRPRSSVHRKFDPTSPHSTVVPNHVVR